MRNRLNNETENLIRLAALERVHQLEKQSTNLNVLEKQLQFKKLANEIILRANAAPKGLIEVVITNRKLKADSSIKRILLTSVTKISGFNTFDPENQTSLFRTIIVIDPMWENITIYGSEYGLPISQVQLL